jgi:transcriptional regulator with XRE-family HTH domain
MPDGEETTPKTLAQKIDQLFQTMHPGDRGEYSYEEVAERIREQGTQISASYIWMLRKGQQDNPSKKHLEAIATFFGVPVAYFFDVAVAAGIDAELELLAAMREAEVQDIALRAAELTPAGRRIIAEMITQLRQMQDEPAPSRRTRRHQTEGEPPQDTSSE